MKTSRSLPLAAAALAALAATAPAQQPKGGVDPIARIAKPGPMTGLLGNVASVKVPKDFLFIDRSGMPEFCRLTQNIHSPNYVGCLLSDEGWFVVFNFEDTGYVKDDEKDKIRDADKMLAGHKENQVGGNEELKRRGLPQLEIVGWQTPPYYDEELKSLAYGLRLRTIGQPGETVNFTSYLLGRRGTLKTVLVADPNEMAAAVPRLKQLIKDVQYNQGERYADFKEGDKLATYGLAALAAGGGVAVLAKTGLLTKFLKPIIVGVVVVAAAVGSFFKKLFGRG